jgi:hypothetical protein
MDIEDEEFVVRPVIETFVEGILVVGRLADSGIDVDARPELVEEKGAQLRPRGFDPLGGLGPSQ